MRPRLWIFPDISSAHQQGLVHALSISPVTASVLLARGVSTPLEANQWLRRDADVQHDPFLLPDIERGIDVSIVPGIETNSSVSTATMMWTGSLPPVCI